MAYTRYGSPVDKQYRAALNLGNWLQQNPLMPHEPFPAVAVLLDDFSGGDDADINGRIAVPSGKEWTSPWPGQSDFAGPETPYQIVSGQARPTGVAVYSSGLLDGDVTRASNPIEVYATFPDVSLPNALMWLISNAGSGTTDGYYVFFDNSSTSIRRLDNGTTTVLNTLSIPWVNGDTVGIRHDPDGTIHVFRNASEVARVTGDTTYTQGQFGILGFHSANALDDLSGGGDEVTFPIPDGRFSIEWPNPKSTSIQRLIAQKHLAQGFEYNPYPPLVEPEPIPQGTRSIEWPNPRGLALRERNKRYLATKLEDFAQDGGVLPAALPFPTQAVIDDFSGGDDADITGRVAVPSGYLWEPASVFIAGAPLSITSGAATASSNNGSLLNQGFTRANAPVEIFATISAVGSSGHLFWLWNNTLGNGYSLQFSSTDFVLWLWAGFGPGGISGGTVSWGKTLVAGDKIGARHDPDGKIHVYLNTGGGWTEIAAYSSSNWVSGRLGVVLNTPNSIDDLGGGGDPEPLPTGTDEIEWPLPKGRSAQRMLDQKESAQGFEYNPFPPLVEPPPHYIGINYDWPNPVLKIKRPRPDHGRLYNDLTMPEPSWDWPNPRVRPYPQILRGFVQGSHNPDDFPQEPIQISQSDWPVPKGYRYPNSLRTFIAVGPHYPPDEVPPQNRQNEWPVPKGYQFPRSLRGFTETGPIYPADPPERQDNWPVPRGYTYSNALRTWLWTGPNIYAADPPLRQDNWPVPKGRPYPISLRTWVNLVQYPPTPTGYGINFDWPVPRGRAYPRDLRGYIHTSDTNLYEGFRPPLAGATPVLRVPNYEERLSVPDFTDAVNVPDYTQFRRVGG